MRNPLVGSQVGNGSTKKVVIVKEERSKSMLFLLKNFFVCGFSSSLPPPVPPSSQPTLTQIWRSILHKKIYPHWSSREPSSNSSSNPNKYIEDGSALDQFNVDDEEEIIDDWPKPEASGSKWDRTDSEYIVLEI